MPMLYPPDMSLYQALVEFYRRTRPLLSEGQLCPIAGGGFLIAGDVVSAHRGLVDENIETSSRTEVMPAGPVGVTIW